MKIKKFNKIIGLPILVLVIFMAGYLVGHGNLVFENTFMPRLANKELLQPRSVDFSMFWKAWDIIQNQYAGKTDAQKQVYGAISGLIDSLDDPYSAFMEPDYSKTFLEDLSGAIQGIGAEMAVKDGIVTVVAPLKESPAEKAGLKSGDQVLKIDDDPTDNLTIDQAVQKIRGKAGTHVKLTIMRKDFKEPQVFDITRAKVAIKSVEWKDLEGNIAYINVSQFGEDTIGLMKEAVSFAKGKNAVILDLRRNPGGYLEGAVDMVSFFIKDSVVVKEKFKDGHIEETKTTLESQINDKKMIVLIDGGSASAAEIVAGALQDAKRATILGEKSFGKGSVQALEELGNGATLRLTIAEWLTPAGRAINHQGIDPDVKVELTEDDFNNNRDPQLSKALELLK